jgi:hypothetical protein
MEINITYRPFSGTISAWNSLDDTMPEADRENIKRAYQDGNDDGWFVNMDTFNGKFHSITVLDSNGAGQGWNLFLSELLDDDTISVIYDQIAKWDATTPRDDIGSLVLTYYRTTVSV